MQISPRKNQHVLRQMQISPRKLVLVSLREGIFKQDNRFHFVGKGKSWVLRYLAISNWNSPSECSTRFPLLRTCFQYPPKRRSGDANAISDGTIEIKMSPHQTNLRQREYTDAEIPSELPQNHF